MKEHRMKYALEQLARRGVPENTNLWPEISAKLERKSIMTTLRARPVMAILIALLILLTLSGVAYALGRVFGYIPGVGLVEPGSALRVLEDPFTVERENIDLNIEQVVASSDKTIVIYNYIAPAADSITDLSPANPTLLLPDGSRLDVRSGSRMSTDGLPTDKGIPIRYLLEFPPLPVDVMEATLELPSLPAMPVSAGSTNWQIPLKLILAPEGTVLPVYKIEDGGSGNDVAVEGTPSSEVPPANTAALHGITISPDLYVPLEDGVLLIGSMQWSEQDYPAYAVRPTDIKVIDATGREISSESSLGAPEKPRDEEFRTYWALKILEKDFAAPLKVTIDSVAVDIHARPFFFQFDPGPNPAPGQSWNINQDIQIGDIQARILKASLTTAGPTPDLVFQFDVQAKPNELGDVYINMSINLCAGGGGGYPTEPSETIQVSVPICQTNLPSGSFDVWVNGGVIWGPWQAEWTQPETSSITPSAPTSTPVSHPEACVNMAKFKQALDEKPELPAGLGGRVILYGPYQGNRSVWRSVLSTLDGSDQQLLGDGDGNFSPDGTKVAFSRRMDETAEQGIFIMDLATNQTALLPGTSRLDFNPMWSPDGSQIVFNRGGVFDLYAINVDGSNMRRLTSDQGQEFAIGWMPDGQHLLYALSGKPYQYTDHIVDVQTGQIEYFSNEEFLGMSPDTKYKITAEREPANPDAWISYLSNLDGSNRWALAESDIVLQSPIWSNDGEWLLVSVSKLYDDKNTPVFIHLTDCQIIPLPKLDGIAFDWLP